MNSRPLGWAFVAVLLVAFSSSMARSQNYEPGPAPVVGEIMTLCMEMLPSPQSRKTIGIGENVQCWIGSFQDTDYYVDPYGNKTPVEDTMGKVIWSVSGPATVNPEIGSTTTLTADLNEVDADVTVNAEVHDSGLKGVDPPVKKAQKMAVKVPTGINVWYQKDVPLGIPGPPNNQIGANTMFDFQVLPNTVNFKKVQFQENIPKNEWTWNDGTKDSFGPKFEPYTVDDSAGGKPNMGEDDCNTGLHPAGRLAGKDQSVTWKVPSEFQDKAGKWVVFLATETHVNAYVGATLKCTITLNATDSASGKAQGPWK